MGVVLAQNVGGGTEKGGWRKGGLGEEGTMKGELASRAETCRVVVVRI